MKVTLGKGGVGRPYDYTPHIDGHAKLATFLTLQNFGMFDNLKKTLVEGKPPCSALV